MNKLIISILEKSQCTLSNVAEYTGIDYGILWRMKNQNQTPTEWEIEQLERFLKEKTDWKITYINRRFNKYKKAGKNEYIKGDSRI